MPGLAETNMTPTSLGRNLEGSPGRRLGPPHACHRDEAVSL